MTFAPIFADLTTKPGRGGARPGAGRPRKAISGTPPSRDSTDELERRMNAEASQANFHELYAEQRARHEKIKADERELSLKIQSGEYLPRAAFRAAAATAVSQLAQHLRGVGDLLERDGLDPDWCIKVEAQIDKALEACAHAFKATHESSNA